MLNMAKKAYVGLDLGHFAIKAVQLERTASGWKVTRAASVPTPKNRLKTASWWTPPRWPPQSSRC